MELVTRVLDSLKSGAYDDMTNDELYDLILDQRYNILLPNCLLLLVKIIDFEDRKGDRLQDKGFTRLHQQEERDVRDLRRNVEKRCEEFMHSLCPAGAYFQAEKGGIGVLTSAGLEKILLPLLPFTNHFRLQKLFRLSFLGLVKDLNSAFTYRSKGLYGIARNELAQAFRRAAGRLEWALAQHVASKQSRVPEENLEILSPFKSLAINSSPQKTKDAARPGFSQIRTARAASSAYPQSPPATPPRRPTETTAPLLSQAAMRSPPPTPPRFGHMSPIRSPQAASSTRSAPTCTKCKQTGHSSPGCPKTRCYKCKYSITVDSSVVLVSYYTTITRG